ncbi:MAG TPA: four helix bundle protein [Pirellulales bacterium]|nr:four helix bundle protein [Pirellulales bacterium]
MAGRDFRDLTAWQRAMDLAEAIYVQTSGFPHHETFGLRSQLRRAATSLPSNIAEGQGRRSRREFRRFLAIACGSLSEVETQILLAERLKYLTPEATADLTDKCAEVGRLLNGLLRSLETPE